MKDFIHTYDLAIIGGTILSMDKANGVTDDSVMLIKSGIIDFIGPKKDAPAFNASKTIIAKGKYLLPAFFNQHTHLSLSLYRGLGTDLSLHDWLENVIWPLENDYANPDNVYLGSLLSLLEMIKNGTGTIADMDFHSLAVGRAVEESGLRAFLGEALFDEKTPSSASPDETFEYTERMLQNYADNDLISIYLTPHATFSCAPGVYKRAGELGRKWNIPVCSHLSETKEEVELIRSKYGLSPVQLLDKTGVFEDHFIAVHGVHLDEKDMETLSSNEIPVIHNPHSNMVLGSGLCPVIDLQKHGITVGLGTDSASSNNHLSMLREMQTAYLIHKGANQDPTVLPAQHIIEMATKTGFEVYRMENIGQLTKGSKADFQIIDLGGIHNQPVRDPYDSIVTSAYPSDIKTLVVNGKIIMEDRKVATIDEDLILSEAKKFGARVRIDFPHLINLNMEK